MSTIYVTRPADYRGRHRRPARTHVAVLAAMATVWVAGLTFGTLATTGVVR